MGTRVATGTAPSRPGAISLVGDSTWVTAGQGEAAVGIPLVSFLAGVGPCSVP